MKIYIHSNYSQLFGAKVSKYLFNKLGITNIEIKLVEDDPFLTKLNKKKYLRAGKKEKYLINDLQSFTLTRFSAEMDDDAKDGYLMMDPDIFPIKNPEKFISEIDHVDTFDLLARPLPRSNHKEHLLNGFASSVFYRKPSKGYLWDYEKIINDIFNDRLDYNQAITLSCFNNLNIKDLPEKMNSYDQLNDETILLHNTGRVTQPWKSGLEIDYINHKIPKHKRLINKFIGRKQYYLPHPDKNQIEFFITSTREAMNAKYIDESYVLECIKNKYIRSDMMQLLESC